MNNLPFRNQFVTSGDSLTLVPDKEKEEFRRFFENKKKEEEQQAKINTGKNFDNFSSTQNIPFTELNKMGINIQPETIRYEKITEVSIHSADRDINTYPNPNDFTVFLQKTFKNVKKIEMVTSEFTNTDQVIKNIPFELQNNLISWQNAEDKYINFYTNVSIETTITNYIDIIISSGHKQTIGSNVIINIYNSKLNTDVSITGFLDGKRQVTVIDSQTLRFQYIGGISTQGTANIDLGYPIYTITLKPGNYTADTLATQMQTSFNTIKRLNGSGTYHYFTVSVNLDTDIMTLDSVKLTQIPNNSLSTTSQSFTITVNQKGHGLKTGDRVKMVGVKNLAGIDASTLNGDFFVTVLDFNTFTYDVNTAANNTTEGGGNTIKVGVDAPFRILFDTENTRIQFNTGFPDEDSSELINVTNPITTKTLNISNAESINLGQQIRFTTTVDHTLQSCNIINISNIATGLNPIVTTSTQHFLDIPQKVLIRNTNCSPQLDNFFFVYPISPTSFIVQGPTVMVSGTTGQILYSGDQIAVYNLQTVPAMKSNSSFFVENIPSSNQFDISFHVEEIIGQSIINTVIGTSQVFINHPSHNFNWLSSIVDSGGVVTCKTYLPNTYLGFRVDNVSTIDGPSSTNTIDILLNSHGLITSDSIKITNSTSNPSINGTYNVQVVDLNTLRINFVHSVFTSGTASIFTGDQLTISYSKSLPRIDGTYYINNKNVISNISIGTLQTTITTLYSSNWSIGDTIVISSSNSTPPIDGTYTINSIIDTSNFTINLTFNVNSIGTYGVIINNNSFDIDTGFNLISNYTSGNQNNSAGIIGRNLLVTHYRIIPTAINDNNIGGLPLIILNSTPKTVERLIDINNYMVRVNNNFSTKTVTEGGSNVTVSSTIHGLRSIQANTNTGETSGTLYRSMSLEGYNFVFLRSPGLKLDTVLNTANISDVFAKILLTESPGTVMFNSFSSVPKVYDTPLSVLEYMRFQVVGPNGYLFNFNNINYSFSLLITEIITQLVDSNMSSISGNYDIIPINQQQNQGNSSFRRLGSDSNKAGTLTSGFGPYQYIRSDTGRGYNRAG